MMVIGFTLLGAGLVVAALLALADPILLSRINGEPAEGARGRFIKAEPVREAEAGHETAAVREAKVVPLPARSGGDRHATRAA
ncbi:hypothetical protein [Nonomuraea sp. NPDC049309]|uniref:hypothetical protein n=1 Tax=Nonomuraea sp. NPDC049309 TaxID=3364350 RepID=UPI0037138CD8